MKKNFLIVLTLLSLAASAQKQITVAKDSTGDYKTIQAAIDAIPSPNNKPIIIKIKEGVYKERVIVDSGKNFITFRGDPTKKTMITFSHHSGSVLFNGDTLNTWNCGTVMIFANDFRAENIYFQNNAGFYAGQAVAVRAHGNRISFKNCAFMGFQDVLFLSGSGVKHYFENCYIEGTTDFIFGAATAVFKNCRIHSKKNSHITAASTSAFSPFGFVFFNCTLTSDDKLDHVTLGRPWRPYASVTYINCQMGKHIFPKGWDNWKNPENEASARYAEYNSTGPGANPSARVAWSKQLTAQEVKKYTLKNIFGNWVPK
jgi:pectinesterase